MQSAVKKSHWIALGLFILLIVPVEFRSITAATITRAGTEVPVPTPGQKKIVFKNLGMT